MRRYACLIVLLTACGDPSQFNEIMTGEPIYENPQTETTVTTPSTDKATTYAGEQPEASTASEPASTVATENPSPSAPGATAGSTLPKLFADCDDSPDKAIVADLFQLPEDTARLPDFTQETALRNVCLGQLNIKDREFTEGFPGIEDLFEWFALDMRFQVNAPKAGNYEFTLASDDGAILWIDDRKVIDNDGLHAVTEKKAKVYLTAGAHSFHVSYYQGPRYRIALELFWKVPGTSSKVYIPASAISRP